MKKLLRNSILALLLINVTSCSPSSSINGRMHKNIKGIFHIVNTNTDLIPEYYYIWDCKDYSLYMKDNYDSEIRLSRGTFVFFIDGNCLICNHK